LIKSTVPGVHAAWSSAIHFGGFPRLSRMKARLSNEVYKIFLKLNNLAVLPSVLLFRSFDYESLSPPVGWRTE